MKIILTLALAICISDKKLALAATNKIKVTEFHVSEVNKDYINAESYRTRVIRVNDTYNRIEMEFEIVQDYPMETEFNVKLYRSYISQYHPTLFHEYNTRMCDPDDKYYKYLPDVFTRLPGSGPCISKGKYDVKDAGIFKFWELIPNDQLELSFFVVQNEIRVGNESITKNYAKAKYVGGY